MFLILFLLLLVIAFTDKISKKYKILLMSCLMIFIIIVSIGLGTDYFSYHFIYKYTSKHYFDARLASTIEPAYLLIMKPFQENQIPFGIFSNVIMLVILTINMIWIYRNSNHMEISVLIYFSLFYLVWTMSALRQGIVLAIGSLIFFDREFRLKKIYSLTIIFILFLVHKSALFYIPILLIPYKSMNRKRHLIFLLFCLALTFVPFLESIEFMGNVRFFDRVTKYYSNNIGFFDFPSAIRLLFFFIVFINYPELIDNKYNKRIVDSFLIGISFYFSMKFSEVIAARGTIYTFVLLVLIFPIIFDLYIEKYVIKFKKLCLIMCVSTLCFIFMTKEILTYKSQVGYLSNKGLYNVETIWDFDPINFDNLYVRKLYKIGE